MNYKFKLIFLISLSVVFLALASSVQAPCTCECVGLFNLQPGGTCTAPGTITWTGCVGWSPYIDLVNARRSCVIRPVETGQCASAEKDSCAKANSICHMDYCPSGGNTGDDCCIWWDRWAGWAGCVCDKYCGVWDNESKCIQCSGRMESINLADTSGIYGKDNAGDNQCESVCGADPVCDEKSPNNDIPQCGCGKTYIADACDSNCGCVDRGVYCSSVYADCTASPECNDRLPDSYLSDSCGTTTLEVSRYCSSTCTYSSTKYTCDSANCGVSRRCGGSNYYCVYDAGWKWATSKPTNFCCSNADCNDNNPCTTDTCGSNYRCSHTYNDGASCSGTPYCSGTNRCGGSEGDIRYYDFKCQSGNCVATSSENCKCDASDSDVGQTYTTKGTCIDYTGCSGGYCQQTDYTDYCINSTHVREYYVSGSGDSATCSYTEYDCRNLGSYTCYDGKCITEICNDGIDNDYDGKIDCDDENCQITITSSPTGSGFVKVDGSDITTPQTYCAKDSWAKGTTHTLSANSPVQPKPALKFIFSSWSDGGAQTHTITVPSSLPATYTANYNPQVYLSVVANPSAGGSVSGSGWYNFGATPTIQASANAPCYSFSNWTANWGGGYNGTANPASVSIDISTFNFAASGNTSTETANFGYNNGVSCGTQHCSNSATHTAGDDCTDVWCDYRHYGQCSSGNCVYLSENCDNYDNNDCRCRISNPNLIDECKDYECVPLFGNTCAWTGNWLTVKTYTCDSSKVGSTQLCRGTTYYCCYDNGYKWQTTPCGTCSYILSISPSSGSYSDTTNTWSISATDSSNSYCPSPINYAITYSTSGSCDSSNTYVSPTSFSISRGSTLNNAFTVKVTRSGSSCNLSLSVKDPNGNVVATGTYTVSQPCTCTGWSSIGCGILPCASDQMKQSRSCSPSGCDIEEQCVADPLCTACNFNGVCDVAGPDMGETQINCPNDCYTIAKIIPWENLLPGAEVKVVVYFNDSRWYDSRYKSPGRDANLSLFIDNKEWAECVVHKKRWKDDIGWPGDREVWPTVYQGKSVVITSTLGYAKLEANCSLPMWLGSGSHQFVAIPTIYSEPTVLAPATARFTVSTSQPTAKPTLNLLLEFLKQLLLLKIF